MIEWVKCSDRLPEIIDIITQYRSLECHQSNKILVIYKAYGEISCGERRLF